MCDGDVQIICVMVLCVPDQWWCWVKKMCNGAECRRCAMVLSVESALVLCAPDLWWCCVVLLWCCVKYSHKTSKASGALVLSTTCIPVGSSSLGFPYFWKPFNKRCCIHLLMFTNHMFHRGFGAYIFHSRYSISYFATPADIKQHLYGSTHLIFFAIFFFSAAHLLVPSQDDTHQPRLLLSFDDVV